MADLKEVLVPDVGGEEVEVIEVLVSEGDSLEEEDALVTVESDKASMDIPVPFSGTVKSIKVSVGDKIKEGDLLAELEAGDSDDSGSDESGSDESDAESDDKASDESADEQSDKDTGDDSEDDEQQEKKADTSPKKSSGGSETVEVKVPDIGEDGEVDVIEVLVSEGDEVAEEDGLITLETDKATMDVPSPQAGKVKSVTVKVGDKVGEGSVILELEVAGGESDSDTEEAKETKDDSASESDDKSEASDSDSAADSDKKDDQKDIRDKEKSDDRRKPPVPDHPLGKKGKGDGKVPHASPAVRRVAREFGVDLTQVKGSGPKSRIVKEDVQDYVKYELSRPKASATPGTGGEGGLQVIAPPKVDYSKFGEIEKVQMSRIQRISGPNLHRNWVTIPHVTQFDEADITELEKFRKAENEQLKKQKADVKFTPLVFIMKAVARALREFPVFNSSLHEDGEHLIMKKYVHIGIAVDTPNGLVVPVIRDVDQKGIVELSEELMDISGRARDGKLKADEMKGGCFSISSLGGIGGTAFTPIVNAPEVAILGVSKSEMKPHWNGSDFEPRLKLPLSLSYDHRVIDGAEAARFSAYLSGVLSDIRKVIL